MNEKPQTWEQMIAQSVLAKDVCAALRANREQQESARKQKEKRA